MNVLKTLNKINKENNIKIFEKLKNELNFEINQCIKEMLINYNVAKPLRTYHKDKSFVLNYFFGFSDKYYEDFIYNYKAYLGRMPKELYPVGSADGGNLVCVDKNTDEIYFWFHEEDDWGMEGNTKYPVKIAKNLNEYLGCLISAEKPTEEEIKKAFENRGEIKITETSVRLRNEQRSKKGLPPLTFDEWYNKLNDPNRKPGMIK